MKSMWFCKPCPIVPFYGQCWSWHYTRPNSTAYSSIMYWPKTQSNELLPELSLRLMIQQHHLAKKPGTRTALPLVLSGTNSTRTPGKSFRATASPEQYPSVSTFTSSPDKVYEHRSYSGRKMFTSDAFIRNSQQCFCDRYTDAISCMFIINGMWFSKIGKSVTIANGLWAGN